MAGSAGGQGAACDDPAAITDTDNDGEIVGTPGADLICGDNDREIIRALGGDDTVFAGGDASRPKTVPDDILVGNDGDDELFGEGGLDKLRGGDGDDTLDGGPVSDNLRGNEGADVFIGGQGIHDTAIYGRTVEQPLTIDLSSANGANDGAPGEGDDIRGDVESAIGGRADDVIRGDASPNGLWGRGGEDTLNGGPGADAIYGERGFDGINAADSRRDQVKCGPSEAALPGGEALVDAIDDVINCDETVESPQPGPPPPSGPCSNLVAGTKGDDDLRGTRASDLLRGRGGDDRLAARRGGDCLRGGKGADEFRAGPGKDKVRSRDGVLEFIRCGRGKDVAVVGPNERTRHCERVKRPRKKRG